MRKFKRIKIFVLIILIFIYIFLNRYIEFYKNTSKIVSRDNLEIHIIDVKQSESVLIIQNRHTMLVDAGLNSEGEKVEKYIKDLGIDTIDVLLITHFHRDHAGGVHNILRAFKVKEVMCLEYENITTLQEMFWYFDMRIAKKVSEVFGKNKSKVSLILPYDEDGNLKSFTIGNASIEILSQFKEENVNNKSIVFKLVYDDFSMLFMGDAEKEVEEKLVKSDCNLSSDILKIGHHGSQTSTTSEFLDKVSPEYAVISCGINNPYNHPDKNVMKRLNERKIKVYRTDEMGDIVITINNGHIQLNKEQLKNLKGV